MVLESWVNDLTPSMVPDGICKEIADEIGAENLLKLSVLVGGSSFYMPKAESILRPLRDQKIKEAYNGYNSLELAGKYGVTQRHIQQIAQQKAVCLTSD
nr:Mor transcription activator family protein [uncultured Oscillibacter sp.]